MPAACIGAAQWVRLGVKATATPKTNPDNPSTILFFADDGHRDDFRDGSIGMGPRIGRG